MKIAAVVVAFNPNVEKLAELCARLASEDARVIVVDNSECGARQELALHCAEVVALGRNTGIACAQNLGIRRAVSGGADVVVLFDQDSSPCTGFLSKLQRALVIGSPGVAAPVCIDRDTRREIAPMGIGRCGWPRKLGAGGRTGPYEVDLVIASGCAVTVQTFAVAGFMDEGLFIDLVDFEWCFRCRRSGIQIQVVPDAVLTHTIGQRAGVRGRVGLPFHSAKRTYYKIRNGFLLYRNESVPRLFSIRAIVISLGHSLGRLPHLENRSEYLRMMIRGVCDGIRGITGPLSLSKSAPG